MLLLSRLERETGSAREAGQRLFDVFCRDLDANLREMGVGDFTVPKRMRRFGEAFYGRRAVYLAAFAAAEPGELEKALTRNIFEGVDAAKAQNGAARLARYSRAALREIESKDGAALLRGDFAFPDPSAVSEATVAHG